MSKATTYFMSEATFEGRSAPYQVQTFVEKEKPPVCQDFTTYDLAAGRICELVKAPICPMTGGPLQGIKLVKMTEPETLFAADINAAGEMLEAKVGVQAKEAAETEGLSAAVGQATKLTE